MNRLNYYYYFLVPAFHGIVIIYLVFNIQYIF